MGEANTALPYLFKGEEMELDLNAPEKLASFYRQDSRAVLSSLRRDERFLVKDQSWREYLQEKLACDFRLPFINNGMEMQVTEDNRLLIKGWSGRFQTTTLYSTGKTYLLVEPIKYRSFTVYAMYDSNGYHNGYAGSPMKGCHWVGRVQKGIGIICTGDFDSGRYDMSNLIGMQTACMDVASSLRSINIHSLGSIYLPGHGKLKNGLLYGGPGTNSKMQYLLNEGLIVPILA